MNATVTLYDEDEDDPYNDRTSLHYAAYYGHKNVAKLLIDNGSDVNVKDEYGWTPLHSAAIKGDLETVQALLKAGADMTAKDKKGRTSLHSAAIYG